VLALGVDPGSVRTGFGVVDSDGRRHRLVEHGVVAVSDRLPLPDRLRQIHAGVMTVIDRCHPDGVGVEDVFHAVNTRSALVLGHVRGVILLAAAQAGVAVHAFPPATVKQQITGSGRADKVQVAWMVSRLLGLGPTEAGDATDALAIALCLAFRAPHAGLGARPGSRVCVAASRAGRPRR
jgi:crossover junction endodeoxyribonuclease RuvC